MELPQILEGYQLEVELVILQGVLEEEDIVIVLVGRGQFLEEDHLMARQGDGSGTLIERFQDLTAHLIDDLLELDPTLQMLSLLVDRFLENAHILLLKSHFLSLSQHPGEEFNLILRLLHRH